MVRKRGAKSTIDDAIIDSKFGSTTDLVLQQIWFYNRFGSATDLVLQQIWFYNRFGSTTDWFYNSFIILIAVVYTAIKYRNDPSIIDHYEDGYFGEKAKLEIRRQKKEKSKETCDENEELERGVAARQRSSR
ncbi:hypothetical protein KUTeg_008801 [Tegillarca granosa]|uniref:Uncharacterized protein n=1 Tax=Tegillarca granosa TaxID=220873 RepID=A0ABQ9FA76_TEGGR|nr:hypothetical protein KUTeg_008801 [Tegillarca granosa]